MYGSALTSFGSATRVPNFGMSSSSASNPASPASAQSPTSVSATRRVKRKRVSLCIPRNEEEEEEPPLRTPKQSRRVVTFTTNPGTVTHYGRKSVEPLAFWLGEKAVFGYSRFEQGQIVLPSIEEVIRIDEVPEPRRRKTPGQPRRRRLQRRVPGDDSPEEEAEESEDWENMRGIIRATVMDYDDLTERGIKDRTEEAGT